jgi:hypothetical protein
VDSQLRDLDEFLMEARERLEQAQQYYKHYYDRKHRANEFATGDWVWLHLLHRPLASLDIRGDTKLGPKFFGLFMVMECIGAVACKLQLPEGTRLHNVFHVGVLKKFYGTPPKTSGQLSPIKHGRACVEPEEVFKSRLAHGRRQLLVKWKGQNAASASWVDAEEF